MAQTYAIVEFEKKDCAIVPMTWICGNNCFWPKANIPRLVSEYAPPKEDWSQHMIIKIHDTLEGIENCERRLSQIIEESTNSESVNCLTSSLVRREIMNRNSGNSSDDMTERGSEFHNSKSDPNINELMDEDDVPSKNSSDSSEDLPLAKRKKTLKVDSSKSSASRGKKTVLKAKKKKIVCRENNVWPNSSSSDDDEKSHKGYNTPSTIKVTEKLKTTFAASEDESWNNFPSKAESSKNARVKETNSNVATEPKKKIRVLQNVILPQNNTLNFSQSRFSKPNNDKIATQSCVPSTSSSSTTPKKGFEATVIQHLQKLTEVQDQNTLKIDQMWKFLNESKLKHVSKPEEFPILPVDRKADFQKLEELLLDEPMHTYLKNRLACIGGLNVRTTVMGMLKFCITNRLATKFNWAGQNKKAFKATKLKDVIYEATELCFSSGNGKPSDMNDKVINQAMKDWLRLAAQRKTI